MRAWLRRLTRRREPTPASEPPPTQQPKVIVITRQQARGLLVILLINFGVLIALTTLALSSPGTVEVVRLVTQVPPLATRLPPPTPTPPPPTPTPISPFGGGGAIAFTLRRNGNSDIYAVNAGDKQLIRLVNNPADDRDAAFSPDGSEIAFASHRDSNWDIYRLNISTGIAVRLTYSTTYDAAPAWSPDGKWVSYFSDKSGEYQLVIEAQDGITPPHTIPLEGHGHYYMPTWSPDSKKLAYNTTQLRMWVLNVATGTASTVGRDPRMVPHGKVNTVWSLDSKVEGYAHRLKSLAHGHSWDQGATRERK